MSDPKVDELARECAEEMYELVDDSWWPAEWPKAAAPIIKRHLLRAQAAAVGMSIGALRSLQQQLRSMREFAAEAVVDGVADAHEEWRGKLETQAKEAADG